MSETPRTYAEEAMYSLSSVNSWGMGGWDFARTLERELAAKSAEVERLTGALQDILLFHANDNVRPKAFYISAAALEAK